MTFIYTDSGFSHLLRPLKNNNECPVSFVYNSPPYNNLMVKEGSWTAQMHLILDLLYNQKTTIIHYNNLKNNHIIRNDKIKFNLKKIASFNFVGNRYNKITLSPIIEFKYNIIKLNFKPIRYIKIPIRLYNLSPNSQFLYRRFFTSSLFGFYRYKTFIEYLNLKDKHHVNTQNVKKYLTELKETNLIMLSHLNDQLRVKVTKSLQN